MASKMLPQGEYCAYLRKSRADLEAEKNGEEDVYKTHERILLSHAKKLGITLTKIYREKPVSGERIEERPEMIQLLEDVEDRQWKGVLVVEVERLARGDTMDQGIVAQAFKYSDTLIVTPMRTYDPNDPNDEEYFEFGLFMSRREFKTITRRLQRGRQDAVEDGKYIGNIPPYGYVRIPLPKQGYTLEPHPEQAPIVQLIYSMYTDPDPDRRIGSKLIARYLNEELKIPSAKGTGWSVSTINGILRNPVYYGRLRWKSRPQVRRRDGKSRPRRPREQWIETVGLHPPIIDEKTFLRAQEIRENKGFVPAPAGKISNPFAGIMRCGMCGGPITLRPNAKVPPMLICSATGCKNVGAYFSIVEERVLYTLKIWLDDYKEQWERQQPTSNKAERSMMRAQEDTVRAIRKKLAELEGQRDQIHDLLEQKIYTVEVFMQRSKAIEEKVAEAKTALEQAEKAIALERKRNEARRETIPRLTHVLSVYGETEDPAQKNALLRSIVEKIVYTKEKGGRWSGAQDKFNIQLYPRTLDS